MDGPLCLSCFSFMFGFTFEYQASLWSQEHQLTFNPISLKGHILSFPPQPPPAQGSDCAPEGSEAGLGETGKQQDMMTPTQPRVFFHS